MVLISERLQTPTTTTPDATVQPLGQRIVNNGVRRHTGLTHGI